MGFACPKCGDEMVCADALQLQPHRCSGCGGVWVDSLNIHRQITVPENLWQTLEASCNATELNCPHCSKGHLLAARYGEHELDFCAACKGIFFEPAELKAIRAQIQIQGKGNGVLKQDDINPLFFDADSGVMQVIGTLCNLLEIFIQ
jgi:Zn-finger nucleic acid-binding protein